MDDETEDLKPKVGQHGGARTGAGRKTIAESSSPHYLALTKAKTKSEVYKAQLAELEYKQRARLLVPVEEVEEAWTGLVLIAKERLLSIPARLAPALLRLDDLRSVEQAVRDAIITALEDLSRGGGES